MNDKYKGTSVFDGIRIALNMLWWKFARMNPKYGVKFKNAASMNRQKMPLGIQVFGLVFSAFMLYVSFLYYKKKAVHA